MIAPARYHAISVTRETGYETGPVLTLDAQAVLLSIYEAPEYPGLLRRSLEGVLSEQSRKAITVEQAVLAPDLAPPWIAALLALDAQVSFAGEPSQVALADFLRRVNPCSGGIAAVCVPLGVPGSVPGDAYLTGADAPAIAAIAIVTLTEGFVRQARLALAGVGREPARLADSAAYLVGGPLTIRRIRHVAGRVGQEVCSPGDEGGNYAYRRAMARVLTYCALEQCWRRAYGT